jgi:mono/diheme cytochrome c family protein
VKKEEEKSYAHWFALAAVLLVSFGVWAIWWETVSLRPWKGYQKDYYRVERAKLLKDLAQLVARQNEIGRSLARSDLAPAQGLALQAAEPVMPRSFQNTNRSEETQLEREVRELNAQKEALERRLEEISQSKIAIRQIYLPELGRVDRCQSCHVAIDRPVAVSLRQPFAPHPGRFIFLDPHPPDRFGCTVCHRGQGRATSSLKKAHGQVRYWLEPMLDREHTSASCLKCHADSSSLRGTEKLQEGLGLFKRYVCYGCHKVAGYENLPKVGSPLTEIGRKVNYSWAVKWIQDPRSVIPDARMPNFGLSEEEAHAVADFLFSFTRKERVDYPALEIAPELAEQGRILYNTSRCSICHRANNRGGEFKEVYATDLSLEGSKIQQLDWLMGRIREPTSSFPDTVMPRYRFTKPELRALASYLAAEFVDYELEESKRTAPELITQNSAERGRELVRQYGCFNCHEIQGFEEEGKIGPDLSKVASKPLEQLVFGRTQIERSHESWFKTKLKTPRVFSPELKMPDYDLSDKEIEALTTVLLGLTREKPPPEYVVPPSASGFALAGPVGRLIADVKCLTCHSIRGRGGKFAPDLSFEGSAVEETWLKDFLRAPDMIRPLLGQMPKFNLNEQEIALLAQFIKTTLVDERIPEEDWPVVPSSKEEIQEGQDIYQRSGCHACHQIRLAGGAVGPDLTTVGSRLTYSYLLQRTKDARAFRLEIVEPRYDFSEVETAAIASYLKSLQEPERVVQQGTELNGH